MDLLHDDFDPDGDPFRAVQLTVPPNGTAVTQGQTVTTAGGQFGLSGGQAIWQPPPGFSGTIRFTYTISDGWLTSVPATVTITVGPASQKAGDLDPSFGLTGKVRLGNATVMAAVRQPDGKTVLVGSFPDDAGKPTLFVARETRDYNLDASFGNQSGGRTGSTILRGSDLVAGGGSTAATAVALQPDGSILVGGSVVDGANQDQVVVRLRPDGTLDAGFGTDPDHPGVTVLRLPPGQDTVNGLALQRGGRVVVAGTAGPAGSSRVTLARLDPGGRPDPTFRFDPSADGFVGSAGGVGLQSDGQIVVAGTVAGGGGHDFAVARYTPDGRPDATFGDGGVTTTDFAGGDDTANALAVLGDDRILVGGGTKNAGRTAFALARYTRDGRPDTFGRGGTVTTSLGPADDEINALVPLPGGGVLAAGFSRQPLASTAGGPIKEYALVRYDASGAVDPTFGQRGTVLTPINGTDSSLTALVVQDDGKVVGAGNSTAAGAPSIELVRYNTDGTLDLSISAATAFGRAATAFGPGDAQAFAVAVQPDGKIITAGFAGGGSAFALSRRSSAGVLDDTFGQGGKVLDSRFGPGPVFLSALALQPDGKLLATGYALETHPDGRMDNDIVLARYNPDGTPDANFGDRGGYTLLYFARFPHTRTPKTAEKMRGPSNNGPFGGFGKPAQKAANP